jgi:hypothetical protein
MSGKPTTKIVILIVVLLAVAYTVLSFLSADDGIPEEGSEPAIEELVPGE